MDGYGRCFARYNPGVCVCVCVREREREREEQMVDVAALYDIF